MRAAVARIATLGAAALAGLTIAQGAHGAAAPAATVYDPSLHVTWLADADLAATQRFGLTTVNADGSMDYRTAVRWVNRLNRSNHGRGWLNHSNWTLPITPTPYGDSGCSSANRKGGGSFGLGCTVAPLASAYSHTLGLRWPATAVAIPDSATGPFHDFQPYLYWTNVAAPGTAGLRTFSFDTGWSGSNQPTHFMYVLPVLAGNPFAGSATSGLQAVDGGQAVWQPRAGRGGAGVTWLADADLARSETFNVDFTIGRDGSMQEPAAVAWVKALTTRRWLGRQGWGFPTPQELAALYTALRLTAQHPVVPVPDIVQHGFQDVQPYLYWSCAGPSVTGHCHGAPNPNNQQWSFSFGNGFLGTDVTANDLYVMVYYPAPVLPPPPAKGGCPPTKSGKPITCK